jgi:thioredoxin-like negative regulator of GroEL
VDNFARDRDVKVTETSTYSQHGQKRAREFGVRSVPTLFITSTGNPERIGFVGVPSEKQLNKMINLSLRIEDWEKPQSLLSKIRNIKIKF